MSKLKQLFLLTLFLITNFGLFAQNNTETDSTDAMIAGGKIYVVMVVVITILAGLLLYVYRLDRKIGRIEKDNKH